MCITGVRVCRQARSDCIIFVIQIEKKSHTASKPVGRSASYKRSGAWAVKKKNNGKFQVHKKAEKIAVKVSATLLYSIHACGIVVMVY